MTYPSWQVAAALLAIKKQAAHYRDLTQEVMNTGLCRLGKDAETPAYTLHRVMKHDHPEYFIFVKESHFAASDRAFSSSEVMAVAAIIRQHALEDVVRQDVEARTEEDSALEGSSKSGYRSYYERDAGLRTKAIAIHGTRCMVQGCGFDFGTRYGTRGVDYIEVHHIKPISTAGGEHLVNPKTDLAVVCANCHRMIHRRASDVLSIEELGEIIQEERAKSIDRDG